MLQWGGSWHERSWHERSRADPSARGQRGEGFQAPHPIPPPDPGPPWRARHRRPFTGMTAFPRVRTRTSRMNEVVKSVSNPKQEENQRGKSQLCVPICETLVIDREKDRDTPALSSGRKSAWAKKRERQRDRIRPLPLP